MIYKMLDTPVALIVFNRPNTTQVVFDVIRQIQPKQLFVIADGPRTDKKGENTLCQEVRAIFEQIDWDCQFLINYSDKNLGCKNRVSTGLDWVFSQVEEAIILEDDCVPELSFFQFCQELLEYYRFDNRIMAISGDNFQFGRRRTRYSYYFSRYPHCWGWATWRRAWQHYDIQMSFWPEIRDDGWLNYLLNSASEVRYRRRIFQATYTNQINTWDYRWGFTCWIQNGLTILPEVNLVSNIGFTKAGTHTQSSKNIFANMPTKPMAFPLKHPPFIIRHAEADRFTWQIMYSFPARFKRKIRGIFNI